MFSISNQRSSSASRLKGSSMFRSGSKDMMMFGEKPMGNLRGINKFILLIY